MAAFKLNKLDIERRDRLVAELREHWGKVEDAVGEYNAALTELQAPVEAALEGYHETLAEARGFAEDTGSEAEAAIDDKSEKWQQGDKGQEAGEFREAWQGIELDAVEIEWPGELEVEGPSHPDDLEALPTEAGAG